MADDWTDWLESLLPRPCFSRPFVCDGPPAACNVIVVGENPATQIGSDWWSWWHGADGFDLPAFMADYRSRRPRIAGTRLRLERLRAHGLDVLESNVHRNERAMGHGPGAANLDLLRGAIDRMPNLRAVVAHGKVAADALHGLDLPAGVTFTTTPHFRLVSYAVIDQLAAEILA